MAELGLGAALDDLDLARGHEPVPVLRVRVPALVERGTFLLDAYRESTGDLSIAGEHVASNKAVGTALAAVPGPAAALPAWSVLPFAALLDRVAADVEKLCAAVDAKEIHSNGLGGGRWSDAAGLLLPGGELVDGELVDPLDQRTRLETQAALKMSPIGLNRNIDVPASEVYRIFETLLIANDFVTGEILRVELPDDLLLTNDALTNL